MFFLCPKHLHFYTGYDSKDMPETEKKNQKKEVSFCHRCRSTAPTSCWNQETHKASLAQHSPLRRNGKERHPRPREAVCTSNTQRGFTSDLNATHKGVITSPGLQFYICSVYSGNCSCNLPPREKSR